MKNTISIRSAVLLGLNGKPSLLSPDFHGQLVDILQDKSIITGTGLQKESKEQMAAFFGSSAEYDFDRSYLFAGGMAIIPVQGLLLNRVSFSGWGVTGYDYIRGAFNDALNAQDVKGILFDINSPGGAAQGCFELSAYIASKRGVKPMAGLVNANACSGAYAIGSAVGRLYAVQSADVGSIGVYSMHMDVSQMLENVGIKIDFIFAGDHKVDGNAYEPMSAAVRKDIQTSVDDTYQQFTALVAKNRDIEQSAVTATQARVFSAEEAATLGLIDSVASAEDAVATFRSELSGSDSPTQEVTTMNEQKTQAGNDDAANNEQAIREASVKAVAADRQRRKDITSCEEAKGREKLAEHLADSTDMSVEDAKGVLSASPKAQAQAPATPVNVASPFAQAMAKTGNPEVDDGGGSQEPKGVARLIAAGRKAGVLRASK